MKVRSKRFLALMLAGIMTISPMASATTVLAAEEDASVAVEQSTDAAQEESVTADVAVPVQRESAMELNGAAEVKTHSITTKSIMLSNWAAGTITGMYTMDNVIVTQQEDGTYLVRMHQTSANRNYMTITDLTTSSTTAEAEAATKAATDHTVDWYVSGGADGYWYTVPVKSLDTPLIACFCADDRVAQGKAFGNPAVIVFDKATMAETTATDVVASDIKKLPAVGNVAVTGVTLDATEAALKAGETKTLTATVAPDNATDKTVTWTSSNDAVATVTAGTVTAVAAGTATITATVGDKTATCIVTVSPSEETKVLAVTNDTNMFNVVSAALVTKDGKTVLRFALNSTGYEDLMVGTYEEACATTDGDTPDTSKWVHFTTNADGKYEFEIPVVDGQTYFAIQTLSASNAKKGVYKWYSRQFVLDKEKSTLVTGDYDQEQDLTLTNNAATIATTGAKLETIGGPMSNNYKEVLKLAMSDAAYDKAYVGTAAAAATATAETTIALANSIFSIPIKANVKGGTVDFDYLDKKTVMSFHQVANNIWVEAEVTVSKTGKTVLIELAPVPATGITLDKKERTIEKGESETIVASIAPVNTSEHIVWSSSDSSVAKVDQTGKVTAVADGEATITATASTTQDIAVICVVTVQTTKFAFSVQSLLAKGTDKAAVESTDVVVSLKDNTGTEYESSFSSNKFTFSKLDMSKSYTLTVSRKDCEVVTESGTAATGFVHTPTGETIYTKEITKDNADSTCTVIFQVEPLAAALTVGKEAEAVSKYFAADAMQKVKDAVAAANADETDRTKRESMAEAIMAAAQGLVLQDGTYEGTVVSSSTFAIPDFTIISENGKMRVQITANGFAFTKLYLGSAADAKEASDEDPNMILPDGEMVTNSIGNQAYQFTLPLESLEKTFGFASYAGGASSAKRRVWADQTANFKLAGLKAITLGVTDISLDSKMVAMKVGKTLTLKATVTPADATDATVTWSSNNEAIATVKDGVVTAKAVGTVKITATAGDHTATCTINVAAATQTGTWVQNKTGWWYRFEDGTWPAKQWKQISGRWYYFNANGYMATGWQMVDGKWYYLGGSNDGAMKTGWQFVSGKWYFMSTSGAMLTGWQLVNGKWYLMNSSGAMLTGWQKVNGKWYYMNPSGAMLTGWQKVNGKWYYMNSSGAMLTGWQFVNGKWYYMYGDGSMAANKWIGKYYVNASGAWTKTK